MAAIFGKWNIRWNLQRPVLTDTPWVKNFVEIALSRTVFEIQDRAERGDQNCGWILVLYFPIFSGNSFYSFSVFQNLGKITDI